MICLSGWWILMFFSPRGFSCAWHLPWRTGTTFPNTHEYLILLDCIYAKNGNATRRKRGGGMHQKHDTVCKTDMLVCACVAWGMTEDMRTDTGTRCSLFLMITCKQSHSSLTGIVTSCENIKSLPVSTAHELYDLTKSVFTVCPAPPGTEHINSISLEQPE